MARLVRCYFTLHSDDQHRQDERALIVVLHKVKCQSGRRGKLGALVRGMPRSLKR